MRRLNHLRCWDVDARLLVEEEPGLSGDGLGSLAIAQGVQREIAEVVKSGVLHINSGLFLLGGGDEEKPKRLFG